MHHDSLWLLSNKSLGEHLNLARDIEPFCFRYGKCLGGHQRHSEDSAMITVALLKAGFAWDTKISKG